MRDILKFVALVVMVALMAWSFEPGSILEPVMNLVGIVFAGWLAYVMLKDKLVHLIDSRIEIKKGESK